MKTSKFPTTEKEVIEFEKEHKHNYEYPKDWPTIDEIISSAEEPTLTKYWEANCSSERKKVVEQAFMLIDDLKKQLKLCSVSQQRELLQGFFNFYKSKFGNGFNTDVLEKVIKQYEETL